MTVSYKTKYEAEQKEVEKLQKEVKRLAEELKSCEAEHQQIIQPCPSCGYMKVDG